MLVQALQLLIAHPHEHRLSELEVEIFLLAEDLD
jgi:hypothetical protein